MSDELTHFAERLRVALAKSNMSGAALGRQLGLSSNAVAKWANGHCCPRSSELVKICKILGCSLDWIMEPSPVDVWNTEGAWEIRAKHLEAALSWHADDALPE